MNILTSQGHTKLQKDLNDFLKQRPLITEKIAEARAHGDLKENAEYHAAKDEQGVVEAKIKQLEYRLATCKIIGIPKGKLDKVTFGAKVTIIDEETGQEKTYQIVGDMESDLSNNQISLSTPVGKALMGKRLNNYVEISTPKGILEYVIIDIQGE